MLKVKDTPLSHKTFRCQFILALKQRGTGEDRRRSVENPTPTKRLRISHKKPTLPPERLDGIPHHLIRPNGPHIKQKDCRFCSYNRILAKNAGQPIPRRRRPTSYCKECNVHLCKGCMNPYHTPEAVREPREVIAGVVVEQ